MSRRGWCLLLFVGVGLFCRRFPSFSMVFSKTWVTSPQCQRQRTICEVQVEQVPLRGRKGTWKVREFGVQRHAPRFAKCDRVGRVKEGQRKNTCFSRFPLFLLIPIFILHRWFWKFPDFISVWGEVRNLCVQTYWQQLAFMRENSSLISGPGWHKSQSYFPPSSRVKVTWIAGRKENSLGTDATPPY